MPEQWPQDDTDLRLLMEAEEAIAGELKTAQCPSCYTKPREYGSRLCSACQDHKPRTSQTSKL